MKLIERIDTVVLEDGTTIQTCILTPEAREALTVRSKPEPLPVARVLRGRRRR